MLLLLLLAVVVAASCCCCCSLSADSGAALPGLQDLHTREAELKEARVRLAELERLLVEAGRRGSDEAGSLRNQLAAAQATAASK